MNATIANRYTVYAGWGVQEFTSKRAAIVYARELVRNGDRLSACLYDSHAGIALAEWRKINGKCRKVFP